MASPVSVASVDPVFEDQLTELGIQAGVEVSARTGGHLQPVWYRPLNWSGDQFTLTGYEEPFDRQASNDDYAAARKDGAKPGTTGDLVASTLQLDYLAGMERALKNRRSMRRPRAMAHLLARLAGHTNDHGPLAGMLAQVREVLRLAKEPSP